MFSMHERTQRRVCRVVYVLACIVPTVLTVGGVLYFHRPWQEHDWQRQLENNLHVRASISQVTAPRPGERQLYEVRLADLQSSTQFASVDKLHLLADDSLHAERIKVSFDETAELARIVQGWLSVDELSAVNLKAGKLLLSRSAQQSCELSNVQIAMVNPTSEKRKLALQADVITAGAKHARVRLQIERSSAVNWNVSLDCREGRLPVWLFADFLPGASRWNSASVSGSLQVRFAEDSVEGNLEGTIAPIDLQAWLGQDSPHKLPCSARLQCETLRWRDHQITEAQGELTSESGRISRSLTTALTKLLFCVPGKKLADPSGAEIMSFEKLACKFKLDASGLTVTGNCTTRSSETPGCLFVSDGVPLLLQPTYSNLPLSYFVQVFCPLEKYWLPGMRKAVDLAETLPISESENQLK